MKRTSFPIRWALSPAVILVMLVATSIARAATTNVSFGSFFFNPHSVTIKLGDTVVWTHASGDTGSHTVTGTGSDPICGAGFVPTSCSHTFTNAGTFPYICTVPFHAGLGMTGVVNVVRVGPPPALLTNAVRPMNGVFQFTVKTTANQTNIVQATTNLRPPINWVPIGTNIPTTDTFVVRDTNAGRFQLRFYRVVEP